MWPAKNPNENSRLYRAVKAVSDFASGIVKSWRMQLEAAEYIRQQGTDQEKLAAMYGGVPTDKVEEYSKQYPKLEQVNAVLADYERLIARGADAGVDYAAAQNLMNLEGANFEEQVEKLKTIIPAEIFGYDDDTIEKVVGRQLKEAGATLATAESCTGGNIARLITSQPGASDFFLGSIVSYANRVKREALGVDADLIEKHGAVSEQVVEKMAEGVMRRLGSDFAVATSGIAGPGGGTKEKPVGTTWVAAASRKRTVSKKFAFGERRHVNIQKSSIAALNMLRLLMA